jgi:predicted Zn-dependent protease
VELGKPKEAVPEFQTALKLKPADPAIETNLALAYSKAGDPTSAIPHFKAAFNSSRQKGEHPLDSAFCEMYARALASVGKQAEAIEMFQAAVERGGARPDLFDSIGSLQAQLGNWDAARQAFEHVRTAQIL